MSKFRGPPQQTLSNRHNAATTQSALSHLKSTHGADPPKFAPFVSSRKRSAARPATQNQKSVVRNPAGQKTPITGIKGGAGGTAYGQGGAASVGKPVQKGTAHTSTLLLPSEKEKYGDRCPQGFKKIDLLGKGGIALVWLAEVKEKSKLGPEMAGQRVALKQFPKVRG